LTEVGITEEQYNDELALLSFRRCDLCQQLSDWLGAFRA
jgi:hypothetical protein